MIRIPAIADDNGVLRPATPLPNCPQIVFNGTEYLCYDAEEIGLPVIVPVDEKPHEAEGE